jgi:uncharacterized protein
VAKREEQRVKFFRSSQPKKSGYRLFFATDLHASDVCFRKFLAAASVYEADAIVMGGDMTGKAIVPIRANGRGRYTLEFQGEYSEVEEADLPAVQAQITFNGFYPWIAESAEVDRAAEDGRYQAILFEEMMEQQARAWAALAAERLPDGPRCFISPGNDDLYVVDEVLRSSERIEFPDQKVLDVGPITMVSVGQSNVTPWRTERELEEPELAATIDALAQPVADGRPLVFNFHVPPAESGLDTVNLLDPSYRPVVQHGAITQTSAGSTAVREAIARYEPVVSLHGHIHEGKGLYRLGPTRCFNPGCDYSAGILQGVIIDFTDDGRYRYHAFTAG